MKADSSIRQDSSVALLLATYKDSLALKMEATVVENEAPLSKALPESTLGNWVADAAKYVVGENRKVDACIINYGSIGKDYIAPGPIRRRDFYELIPYENKLLLLSVSGSLLKNICDSIAQINGLPISGLSLIIDSGKATHTLLNKQAINEHLLYTLLINDYLMKSRTFEPLLGKLPYQSANISLRNALFEYATMLHSKGIHVKSNLENRIIYAE